jgi:hypothetical protein
MKAIMSLTGNRHPLLGKIDRLRKIPLPISLRTERTIRGSEGIFVALLLANLERRGKFFVCFRHVTTPRFHAAQDMQAPGEDFVITEAVYYHRLRNRPKSSV